jgi:hypothetical protein
MALSWLDAAVATYLLLHLVTGYQQGLFLGGLSFAILVGAWGWGVALGPALAAKVGGAPWLNGMLLAALVFAGLKLCQGALVRRVGPRLQEFRRGQVVDRWLGLFPGLAWGALGAGVGVWLVLAFLGKLPQGSPLAGALLGCLRGPISTLGQGVLN